ncbi:PxKF domain-containing protein [Ornithinimicrobium cerasi]|uniref:PxKF domain-containing protein n=1 Tax=Ornithinimicrobium cerasi TaxID=2248773 RepID=UPI001379FCC8|nr:PxKF domain-containing protein [Ornithinimicrobium cerasi]
MNIVQDSCRPPARRGLPMAAMAVSAATVTALLGLASPASAETLVVTSLADAGPGTLRDAISAANLTPGPDVIQLDLNGTITLSSQLPTITDADGLTISGPGGDLLQINGNRAVRILAVDGGTLHLSGVTLSDGSVSGGGGGGGGGGGAGLGGALLLAAGSVTLKDVELVSNNVIGGAGGGGGTSTGGSGGAGGGLLGGAGGPLLGGSSTEGQPGGFASGGGGGALGIGRPGGAGGAGGFGGGGGGGAPTGGGGSLTAGGVGGAFGGAGTDVPPSTGIAPDGGGEGGAGLGGAIFVQSGALTLDTVILADNSATGGTGGVSKGLDLRAQSGQGKGGAIFVAEGAAAVGTSVTFDGNAASDDGGETGDDDDLYGTLVLTTPSPVVWPFADPVTNEDVNLMKAGRAVPFTFFVSLEDEPVTDLDSVRTVAVRSACDAEEQTAPIGEVAAGGSGLQNLGGGLYQFNYKTSKSWAGQCWTLGVDLGAGVTRTATFQFH